MDGRRTSQYQRNSNLIENTFIAKIVSLSSQFLNKFFKTEREGFEPSRVLPLNDFESCAINRALPPLLNVKKTYFNLKGPPARRLWPLNDAANVADPAWAENPAMYLSIDLIQR